MHIRCHSSSITGSKWGRFLREDRSSEHSWHRRSCLSVSLEYRPVSIAKGVSDKADLHAIALL